MPTRHTMVLQGSASDFAEISGRHLHALTCNTIERPLAGVHDEQVKFFTFGPLQETTQAPAGALWRLHWLRDDCDVTPLLLHADGKRVRLGRGHMTLHYLKSAAAPFAEMARLPAVDDMTFDFHTPTHWSRSGRRYVLPDPELLVRGLVKRWNDCQVPDSPLTIGPEDARELGSRLELAEHDIRSAELLVGAKRSVTGFVGRVRVRLAGRQRSPRAGALLSRLSAFSNYSGVGAQTTHGCGAVTAWR